MLHRAPLPPSRPPPVAGRRGFLTAGWLAFGLLVGAGSAAAGAQGSAKFDGQYMGELKLTGVVSGDCTRPPLGAIYPLAISGGQVRFHYVPRFDTTLSGTISDDGAFTAVARIPHGVVRMRGRIQGRNVVAKLRSPSCRYTFRTKY